NIPTPTCRDVHPSHPPPTPTSTRSPQPTALVNGHSVRAIKPPLRTDLNYPYITKTTTRTTQAYMLCLEMSPRTKQTSSAWHHQPEGRLKTRKLSQQDNRSNFNNGLTNALLNTTILIIILWLSMFWSRSTCRGKE